MAKVTPRRFFLLCCVASILLTALTFWSQVMTFTEAVYRTSTRYISDSMTHNERQPDGNNPEQMTPPGNPNGTTLQGTLGEQQSKFLIYECASNQGLCGGWADRQEGIVNVFLLAILTNRRLGVRVTSPCDLKKFVLPNEYDWTLSDKDIQGKGSRRINAMNSKDFMKELSAIDFNAKYPEDVIILHTNIDSSMEITKNPHYRDKLPPWANQSRPELFRTAWRMLVKLSPHMEQRLEKFLHSIHYFNRTRPLVGVHVRIGGSANFNDRQFEGRMSRLGSLWDFVQPYVSNGSDVFVVTDNPDVRQSSMAKFGHHHHDTEAVLRYIDYQRSDPTACQAFEDAILDQLILSHCDVLVVAPGSGFSARAAMLRGVGERLFMFSTKGVTPVGMCDPLCK